MVVIAFAIKQVTDHMVFEFLMGTGLRQAQVSTRPYRDLITTNYDQLLVSIVFQKRVKNYFCKLFGMVMMRL